MSQEKEKISLSTLAYVVVVVIFTCCCDHSCLNYDALDQIMIIQFFTYPHQVGFISHQVTTLMVSMMKDIQDDFPPESPGCLRLLRKVFTSECFCLSIQLRYLSVIILQKTACQSKNLLISYEVLTSLSTLYFSDVR